MLLNSDLVHSLNHHNGSAYLCKFVFTSVVFQPTITFGISLGVLETQLPDIFSQENK